MDAHRERKLDLMIKGYYRQLKKQSRGCSYYSAECVSVTVPFFRVLRYRNESPWSVGWIAWHAQVAVAVRTRASALARGTRAQIEDREGPREARRGREVR